MKRFARSVVLSLLLCLTAFATSAAAEGAWVLWGEKVTWARDATGGKTEREWQLTRALSNREECENWLAVNLTVTRERWKSADDPRIAAVDAGSDWMKVTLKTVNGISSGWTTTLPLPPGHRGPAWAEVA